MLAALGYDDVDDAGGCRGAGVDPAAEALDLPPAATEVEAPRELRALAAATTSLTR